MNLKEVIKPAAILFVICVAVSAALAGTNLLTKDSIALAAAKKAEEGEEKPKRARAKKKTEEPAEE